MTALLAAAVAIAVVDALTKYWATAYLVEGRLYGIGGTWGLRRVENERPALADVPVAVGVVLWALIAATAGLVVRVAPGSTTLPFVLGLGLIVGGAFGNLLDRLLDRSVVDFVAAGRWPVFNVADAAMVVGFVIALGAVV